MVFRKRNNHRKKETERTFGIMKKLAALFLCLVLVLSLATPAFAASITFSGGASGAKYVAYRILEATYNEQADSYGYRVNDKYRAIIYELTGAEDDEGVRTYIYAQSSAEKTAKFANDLYAAIQKAGSPIEPDAETKNDVMTNVAHGYYLIVETELGGNNDTYMLHMLDTFGDENVTVTTKESHPEVEKKVLETNDSKADLNHADTWKEYASYDIGDDVAYEITGSVSSRYDSYLNYHYKIVDTMDEGLTLNMDSIVVKVGNVVITDKFTWEKSDHSFTATANLKDIPEVTSNSTIVVTYTAKLNEKAVRGTTGNKNTVHLEFQNNPYAEGKPENPGMTPDDVNVVFTFDAIVNKVDANGDALAGAGFTLYKFDKHTQQFQQVGQPITGQTTFSFVGLDEGVYKLVETTVPQGFNKADDIEFHIHATYDTTKDPVQLIGLQVVNADGDSLSGPSTSESGEGNNEATKSKNPSFQVTLDEDSAEVSTNIVNRKGQELPSTGGMGTTMLYVAGGILVLAAVVLLITKKRMANAE